MVGYQWHYTVAVTFTVVVANGLVVVMHTSHSIGVYIAKSQVVTAN